MNQMSLFPANAVPTTDQERLDWIRLIRSRRVGPTTFQRLMRECGSAAGALEKLPEIARDAGLNTYDPCLIAVAEKELSAAQDLGAAMICFGAQNYPSGLYDLPDPPPFLWAIGRVELLSCAAVAIVGARNASSIGQNMSRKLAREIGAAGFAIVSGLARGIDRAAHEASLESGTIAVLAGGADINYPTECDALANDIRYHGLVLSEVAFGVQPHARHFPPRNRIISGIASGVVVVEGAAKSGSLITARNALDQGREVMAVPGSPLDARAAGCNMLIRDGAQLVRNAADVIACLGETSQTTTNPDPRNPDPKNPDPRPTTDSQSSSPARASADSTPTTMPPPHALHADALLSLLGPTPVEEDQIIAEIAAPARDIIATISELEIAGRLERHPGGRISLTTPVPA